jgi:cyclase
MYKRVIARLDIKGDNLVKGIHLEGLRVLGKPEKFANLYYESGADELIFMDVVASLYNRNSLHEIISRVAKHIFIPLTVGGGLRTIEDIRAVFRAGADKVAINTAAITNKGFISEAAKIFGSSNILGSIEAIKQSDGSYLAYTDNAREYTGVEVIKWAQKLEELGVGELLITSVDNEGTGKGYDLELIASVSKVVSIPVIANGGAGRLEHIKDVFEQTSADAVSIASMLHYNELQTEIDSSDFNQEGNISFLMSGSKFSKFDTYQISEIKDYLIANNIHCRV